MARTGRPTNLTADVSLTIVEAVRSGMYLKHAAMRAGVQPNTVSVWMGKGRRASTGLYHDFVQAVTRARADAVARNVAIIQVAARNDWKAAAWWLARTMPELYGSGAAQLRREEDAELVREAGRAVVPLNTVAHARSVYAVLEQAGLDVRALAMGSLVEGDEDEDDGDVVDEAPHPNGDHA